MATQQRSPSSTGVSQGMTLAEALSATASHVPDRIALTTPGRRLTYRELDAEVSRLAVGLRQFGLSQGDSVVLLLPNGWEMLCGLFAVARAGGVAVPVNPASKSREVAFVVDDVLPALILAVPRVPGNDLGACLVELRQASSSQAELIFAGPDAPPGTRQLNDVVVAGGEQTETMSVDAEPDDLAAIFYTTGTTGTPKGVLHTHEGLVDSFLAMEELYTRFFSGSPAETAKRVATLLWRYRGRLLRGIGPQTWTTPLPLHSIAGFRVALHALLGGHRMVLTERFHPRGLLELIERERVNILAASPSMVEAMLAIADVQRYDLSSLLVVGLGAAPARPGLVRQARAVLGWAPTLTFEQIVERMVDADRVSAPQRTQAP